MFKRSCAFMLIPVFLISAVPVYASCDHEETLLWKANMEFHWQFCEACEEEKEQAEHVMDEFGYCDECDMTIFDNGDDTYCVMTYDEYGTMSSQIDYDEDGNVISEVLCENEYYEDGNPKHSMEYTDGVLTYECFYLPLEDSESSDVYMSEEILYDGDTKTVSTYDVDWNLLTSIGYDEEGEVIYEDVYEYEFDEEGNVRIQVTYTNGIKSYEASYEIGDDEEEYLVHEVYYDEDGEIFDEYYYDKNGEILDEYDYDEEE